jgi:hypothetical protein
MYRIKVVMQSNKVVKSMAQCLLQSTCYQLAEVMMVITFGMIGNDGHGGCDVMLIWW